MKPLRHETRTVREHGGAFFLDGSRPIEYGQGNWTVTIQEIPWPTCGFHIQAKHDLTGAIVPASGEPRYAKALGKAREIGGQLATVMQGTLHDYSWKHSGCAPDCTVCLRHARERAAGERL